MIKVLSLSKCLYRLPLAGVVGGGTLVGGGGGTPVGRGGGAPVGGGGGTPVGGGGRGN